MPKVPSPFLLSEKEKKTLFNKDIVKNNRAFTYDQINVLYECFKNFSNPLNNRVFVEDILGAANTLDLHLKYPILFKVLQQVADDYKEDAVDFETFITELTDRMVHLEINEGTYLRRGRPKDDLRCAGPRRFWRNFAREAEKGLRRGETQVHG